MSYTLQGNTCSAGFGTIQITLTHSSDQTDYTMQNCLNSACCSRPSTTAEIQNPISKGNAAEFRASKHIRHRVWVCNHHLSMCYLPRPESAATLLHTSGTSVTHLGPQSNKLASCNLLQQTINNTVTCTWANKVGRTWPCS